MYTRFQWENLKKETTWRFKCRWQDNTKLDIKEIQCGSVCWICLAQGWELVMVSSEHGNEPLPSIKVGEFLYQLNDCQLLEKNSPV
jgi:uncharacterized protein YuzB (UPF0349 family)